MATVIADLAVQVSFHEPELSDDVISNILARLPFSSLVRAGAVCRTWYRLSRSTNSTLQPASWCLLCGPIEHLDPPDELSSCNNYSSSFHMVMFDPFSGHWMDVANPFADKRTPYASSCKRELLLVPSTGGYSGLVCVVEWQLGLGVGSFHYESVYWVGNPISNQWVSILGPSAWRGLQTLVVNPITKSYKIITICCRQELRASAVFNSWRVEIYDSVTKGWRKGAYFPGNPHWLKSGTCTSNAKTMFVMHKTEQVVADPTNLNTGRRKIVEVEIMGYDIEADEFRSVTRTPLSNLHFFKDYVVSQGYYPSAEPWPKSAKLLLKSSSTPPVHHHQGPHCTLPARDGQSQVGSKLQGKESLNQPEIPLQLIASKTDMICHESQVSIWSDNKNTEIRHRRPHEGGFVNKVGIAEFEQASGAWVIKQEATSKRRTENFELDSKWHINKPTFRCVGEGDGHLYYAHLEAFHGHKIGISVLYNPKRHDFSGWCQLPPLELNYISQYGGEIASDQCSLSSFIPRLDISPFS